MVLHRKRFTSILPAIFVLVFSTSSCGPKPEPRTAQRPGASATASSQPTKAKAKPAAVPHHNPPQTVRPKGLSAPPLARRDDMVETIHGMKVADPYRWLENASDPKVQAWVKAMDTYTRKVLAKLPERDLLAKRVAAFSYLDTMTAPIRRGKRFFYFRRHHDKEKAVAYWREGEKGAEQVLIDPNTLSKDGSISLKGVFPNFQGTKVAYNLSKNNADQATLYVMDVTTGRISKTDTIPGTKYAWPNWTPDGKGFFYTRLPTDPKIPASELSGHAAIYFHRLGTPYTKDALVFQKTGDPKLFIWPELSRDGRWLFVFKEKGWSHTDVYYTKMRRSGPGRKPPKFRVLATPPKGADATYQVFAWKGWFYILTNEGAPHYRLYRTKAGRVARRHWKEIVPESKDAVLDSFAVRGNKLSLVFIEKATTKIRIHRLDGKFLYEVAFPGLGTASQLSGNPEDDVAYFTYSSFLVPRTIFRLLISKRTKTTYFKTKVPFDPSPYVVEQVWYPSKDGTKISMFLIHAKGMKKTGDNPTLLYGYGGFNVSLTPGFSSTWAAWVEQGGLVAIPNLRGGGEYGESWHKAGMLGNKQNVFDDFVFAAKWLIAQGWAKPAKLAIRGGSNGGLLVGAAMVQAPKLFRAVVCYVPLLDMIRYTKFGSGKTWIAEYGDPADPKQFAWLHAYSPYHHVRKGVAYPALLMMSADSDDRVDPMHARKFVAAMRWATDSHSPVLLRVETHSGHGGGDMIKKRVAAKADELAFMLERLGVRPSFK